ncbi:MAG: DUF4097 domain-containing protein [Lachnospiraceae bacterium]|nr:DUF4097 domain-containing protein [Lachnospiraceae bacterium]
MNKNAKIYITVLTVITILVILAGIYIHVFRPVSGFFSGLGRDGSFGENVTDTISVDEEVTAVSVDVDAAEISVKSGEETSVKYNMPSNLVPKVSVEDGVLKVTSKVKHNVDFHFFGSREYRIDIVVKRGTALEDISFIADAGDISIDEIETKDMSIDADAGDIEMEAIKADKISIKTDAGNIELGNSKIGTYDIDSDAGNVEVDDSTIKEFRVKVDAGNVEVENSTVDGGSVETDMGNISLSGKIGDVATKTDFGHVDFDRDN